MLANREITSELSEASVTVKATKGCPQGGVLFPLLWSLVVDDLLISLEERGFKVIGFAPRRCHCGSGKIRQCHIRKDAVRFKHSPLLVQYGKT